MIIKRKLYSKLSGLPRIARNMSYKVMRKVPGIKKNAAEKAINMGRKTEKAGMYLRTTAPEKMIGDFGSLGSRRPIQTAGSVMTFPVSASAAEGFFQKFGPYNKLTSWTGAQYERHLRKPVEGIAKTVINMPW